MHYLCTKFQQKNANQNKDSKVNLAKKDMKRILLYIYIAIAAISAQAQNHNFETAKQLEIFNALYRNLDLYYVDTLNVEHLMETAIDAMLDEIDPYTDYYKESDTDDLKTMTTGKYAGIGSPILWRKACDRCVFHNPYKGMPADKAGIRSGDIILKIDGKDVGTCGDEPKNDYTGRISSTLRGEPGSSFSLTVKRPGVEHPITLQLTRENIKRPSVVYATLLPAAVTQDSKIGYILLDSFTEDTAADFQNAFKNLKAQGAEKLIFDLRANGGGLMQQAIEVVNTFIPRGLKVVETRGRESDECATYKTSHEPLDTDIPIAVLVDYGTASASEITSGAFQDYDRAVIVGRRTYGKGLVQSPMPLPYNTMMKFTTSKYYIPSGRCVQARDFKHRNAEGQPLHMPDSLCKTFHTAAGRPVRDGGGITPDVTVQLDSLPTLITYLEYSDELFDYCVDYQTRHPHIAPARDFHLSAEEFEEFKQFMANSGFTYDNRAKRTLKLVRQIAEQEGYSTSAQAELDALEAKLSRNLSDDLQHWEKEVHRVVESMIVGFYHYDTGIVEYNLRQDDDLNKAIEILNDNQQYKNILKK